MPDIAPPAASSDHNELAFAAFAAAVVRQATSFIALCDAQLRPCFLNAAGREIIGLSADADIAEYEILDFFAPKHRPIVKAIGLPTMLRDGCWEEDLSFRHLTDPSRAIEACCSAFVLRDEAGRLVGAAAFTTGILVRKQVERVLRDQQMLLASVLDNLPLGVGVYDGHGNLIHANDRLRDHLGLTRSPSCDEATSRSPVRAIAFRREGDEANEAVLVVQDVAELKQEVEGIEAARAGLASQCRFLEATLSSIPDFVYAFDPQRRCVYANSAMQALFGLQADEMVGKTLVDLAYPADLADRLNGHIDLILRDGVTVEDEIFHRSPTGYAAYFAFLWGPVRGEDGSVEMVVGVSRDTSERRAFEDKLRTSEARLRAASELVGLGIYSWDPTTDTFEWDNQLRTMWGLPPGSAVNREVFEAGIHPDDLPRVQRAIAECIDPAGSGRYNIEYRVIGRDNGVTRHIATSGQMTFAQGRAVGFIGAAIDVTAQHRAQAAIRASEAQFRKFADHSSNLIWIGDPAEAEIIYRSAAFEKIWGVPSQDAPTALAEWIEGVHPEDRQRVKHTLATVEAGEVAQLEYRIVRPSDGTIRWLRDTSFPIPDEHGVVTRIGGITEDTTQDDVRHVYVVSAKAVEARWLASLVRSLGFRVRTFQSGSAFLDLAPVLAPGCVLVDLRKLRHEGLSLPRELKARSVALPTIALDSPGADAATAVAAMKAGAIDYLIETDEASLCAALASAIAECHGAVRPTPHDENARARIARLTQRECEVLVGLVNGGTNKTIGQELGISPRTVELHRAQVMNRLNASNLTELLQIAMAAGVAPSASVGRK